MFARLAAKNASNMHIPVVFWSVDRLHDVVYNHHKRKHIRMCFFWKLCQVCMQIVSIVFKTRSCSSAEICDSLDSDWLESATNKQARQAWSNYMGRSINEQANWVQFAKMDDFSRGISFLILKMVSKYYRRQWQKGLLLREFCFNQARRWCD